MATEKLPKAGACANPVDRNVQLGSRLGIQGTPTMIFADGTTMTGMRPAQEIERRLNGTQTAAGVVLREPTGSAE